MKSKVKDKLVGIYAPGHYDHTSVLEETQEFSKWFWDNHEDMEFISTKLGISTNKLKRILTLEAMGTKREIAEKLGVSVRSVTCYGTPSYARRTSEEHSRRLVEL